MASSIVPKNLFNFKMLGELDPDAKALADQQEEMRKSSPEAKQMEAKMEELSKRKDPESCNFVKSTQRYLELWSHQLWLP